MGLSIEVGIVADLLENDEEGAAHFQEEFSTLSGYLASVGLHPHTDPSEMDVISWDMYGYSGLHYLRRLAAHLHYSGTLPSPGDQTASQDPLPQRYFSEFEVSDLEKAFGGFDHLIIHSDAEGYYIPQNFETVLIPGETCPIAGGMIGSSYRLRDECIRIAGAIGLPLDLVPEDDQVFDAAESQGSGAATWERFGVESYCCLRLYKAAQHSIHTGAAIVFT
ncbi:MAG: hypothetical protein EOP84_36695 [Verrucomicrobiaceae bacterium]|nr:MAG: hypothetical protein EOP84_36695 [Verrucomicrobiaceae bacterium]